MKKLIGILLVVSILFSTFVFGTTAEEKEFVIDGKLDLWYLSDGENPPGDYHYYHMSYLDAISKKDGISPYDDPVTTGQVWTAYDNDYVYVYVKIWDDEFIDYDPKGIHEGQNGSIADSIEIWFDPDPNSQTKQEEVKDGWWQQTGSPNQGDIQMRLHAFDFEIEDYHDIVKPGYNGVKFSDYVKDKANVYPFYFENEDNGEGVTSGYGVEARFPRYDDEAGAYRLHVAANNSSESPDDHYALATGAAWWQRYDNSVQIRYSDVNPFLNQDVSAKLVVKAIDELPTPVTENDRADVEKIRAQYNALTEEQKDYVKDKNYDVLEEAEKALNIDNPSSGDNSGSSTVERKRGDINGDKKVDANDALLVLRASVGKATLTAEQTKAADLTGDGKVNAADALVILRIAVGKEK